MDSISDNFIEAWQKERDLYQRALDEQALRDGGSLSDTVAVVTLKNDIARLDGHIAAARAANEAVASEE
jgi:hypothetical protein